MVEYVVPIKLGRVNRNLRKFIRQFVFVKMEIDWIIRDGQGLVGYNKLSGEGTTP